MVDLICYVVECYVEIVLELDILGYIVVVLVVYFELGCIYIDIIVKNVGEIVNLMFCVNNEKVYEVYKDIIDEVSVFFFLCYIYLGGDEVVIEKNWIKCECC